MELKEFVSEALKQIVNGVADAETSFKEKKGIINPEHYGGSSGVLGQGTLLTIAQGLGPRAVQLVEFDVALTSMEGQQTKGGIGVFFGTVGLGSQGQSNKENESLTRIKFSVPISLPPGV